MVTRVRELLLAGRRTVLAPGTELTVRGLGRCRFSGAVLSDDNAVLWLDVYEPRCGAARSVTPDRVARVHRTRKLRP